MCSYIIYVKKKKSFVRYQDEILSIHNLTNDCFCQPKKKKQTNNSLKLQQIKKLYPYKKK